MRPAASSEIPKDFIGALEDFNNEHFVSTQTAPDEAPVYKVRFGEGTETRSPQRPPSIRDTRVIPGCL
jgi:hypothetical protein